MSPAGRGERIALIYDSPVTGTIARFTYRELRDEVARLAGALAGLGVGKGDRVLIYMPMVPEAAMAMLACARIGAIHSVVFGGFAAHELATRIDDAKPRVILSASCGIEVNRIIPYKPLLDAAIARRASKPEHCVILQRPMCRADLVPGRDHDWRELDAAAQPADCVPVLATDPLYILYTSGTTGIPKGVVRDNGGHAVALRWSLRNIYGVEPDEVFWTASDVGWVVGHSYIVYAPLLLGCTTVMYEGKPVGTPDAGAFWRVIERARGARLLHRADRVPRDQARGPGRAADPRPRSQRSSARCSSPASAPTRRPSPGPRQQLGVAGHRPLVADRDRLADRRQLPRHRAAAGQARLGDARGAGLGRARARCRSARARRARSRRARSARLRSSCRCRRAHCRPCGRPTTLSSQPISAPFPAITRPPMPGFIDEDGYIHVMTRTDDIINVAGHRLSTGEIEEVLAAHPDVAECAVIGVADALKGQVPLGLVVLKAGVARSADEIERRSRRAGARAHRPGRELQDGARRRRPAEDPLGQDPARHDAQDRRWRGLPMPATIDDPAILGEIGDVLGRAGYAERRGEA